MWNCKSHKIYISKTKYQNKMNKNESCCRCMSLSKKILKRIMKYLLWTAFTRLKLYHPKQCQYFQHHILWVVLNNSTNHKSNLEDKIGKSTVATSYHISLIDYTFEDILDQKFWQYIVQNHKIILRTRFKWVQLQHPIT